MPEVPAVKERYFVQDMLQMLLERGREARERHRSAKDPLVREFEAGQVITYYGVLSTLVGQLEAFGIPPEDVRWDQQLDLESEFLSGLGANRHGE